MKARGKLSAPPHPRPAKSAVAKAAPGHAAKLLMAHAKHIVPSPKKSPRAKP